MSPKPVSIVAKYVRICCIFATYAGEFRGRPTPLSLRLPAREAVSVLGRRYAEVPQERPPHAFVVAEAGALGDFDHTADLSAFEQQARCFYP